MKSAMQLIVNSPRTMWVNVVLTMASAWRNPDLKSWRIMSIRSSSAEFRRASEAAVKVVEVMLKMTDVRA